MDRNYVVRGFYKGLDSASIKKLAEDIGLLMLAKDSKEPGKLPFDPVTMGIFFALTVIIVVVGIRLIFKNKIQAQTTV
jgi:protein SCO1/2